MSAEQRDPDDDLRRRLDEREFLREAEAAAEQLERNTRTLMDVVSAAAAEGHSVVLDVGAVTVAGNPVAVNDSVAQVAVGADLRLVNLAAVTAVSVVGSEKSAGVAEALDTGLSLVGLLRSSMTHDDAEPVRLVTTSGREWQGRVVGVADDHVELEADDGSLHACRLDSLAYVVRHGGGGDVRG